MLKWIRGKRLDMKTTVFFLVLAVAVWAMMLYVNARDFIPEEYRERWDSMEQAP